MRESHGSTDIREDGSPMLAGYHVAWTGDAVLLVPDEHGAKHDDRITAWWREYVARPIAYLQKIGLEAHALARFARRKRPVFQTGESE